MTSPTARRITAALLATLASACSDDVPPPPRVNIVLVVVDTLRADYADPSSGKADLPHLAAFARDAVAFPFAYSHAPMTLPSHAALFSARTPQRTGVTNNGQAVSQELPLLQEWLVQRGYANQAAVSLATLWPRSAEQGIDRGFEHFERGASSISKADDTNRELGAILDSLADRSPFFVFAHYAEPHEPYEAHGLVHRTATLAWNGAHLESVGTTDWSLIAREVTLVPGVNRLEFVSEHDFKLRALSFESGGQRLGVRFEEGEVLKAGRRVVAAVDHPGPEPVVASLQAWLHDAPSLAEVPDRYRREAEAADQGFGALVALLKARGLYDSSLIVFTSDHGEALGEHGVVGHVVNLHDEMLHVPLMIKLPKGHAARPWLARSQRDLARLIDVAPTILDALGLPALPGQQGESLLASRERVLLAQTSRPEAPRTLYALRDQRTKLVYDVEADRFQMYDLATDPGELVDVFAKSGSQRQAWQAELRAHAATPPSLPAGNVPVDARVEDLLRALGY